MPRYLRDCPWGSVQHVVHRFLNREYLFDDTMRLAYVRRLAKVYAQCDWLFFAYALMSTHIHLACLAGLAPAWSWLKPLHIGIAREVNQRFQRLGPVFAERPRTIGVPEEHLARLIAYQHNNPVRAGVVRDPVESSWTSHRFFVGEEPAPPWLDVAKALSLCGFDSSSTGRLNFHQFVLSRAADSRDSLLSGETSDENRARVRALEGATVELGQPNFVSDDVLSQDLWVPLAATRHRRWEGDLYEVLGDVAVVTRCSVDELQSSRRFPRLVRGRRLFVLAGIRLGRPLVELAAALGVSCQAASKLCRVSPATLSLAEDAARIAASRLSAL